MEARARQEIRVSALSRLVALLFLLVGCTGEEAGGPLAQPVQPPVVSVHRADPVDPRIAQDPKGGDIDAIRARGRLRILTPANLGGVFFLPREGWPAEAQYEAAESFASEAGLQPEIVPIARFGDMIPALLNGEGDLIAANLTITENRRQKMAFSVPLTTVRQQVLVAVERGDISRLEDLAGKTIMVDPSSSFWERLQALRLEHPTIELVPRPPGLSDEGELDLLAAGGVDATVRDSNVADRYLDYREDIRVAFALPGIERIAWGVRRDSPRLRAALNRFLHLEFAGHQDGQADDSDWNGITRRKTLRVLLRNNAASYFVHRGELHGFEYELARAFADRHRLRLEVIVPDSNEQMLAWLLDGRADLAAGFLEPSEHLRARGFGFSRPYHFAPRHLVIHAEDGRPRSGMAGRTITVSRDSPYINDLERLRARGVGFHVNRLNASVETEELIERVARGEIEATIADGHLLDIELARGLPVMSGARLKGERAHAVVARAGDEALLEQVDGFIQRYYRGTDYNVLRNKYFRNRHAVRDLALGRLGREGASGLSPYDKSIRQYAEMYGFDWRLIAAQMYQESRFDPAAISFAGARGLLQVLPRTAKFMGFDAFDQPEEGIHAGVKYMDWVRDRFEPTLPFNERLWFTLAAYNAGHGHVQDARRLARRKGWDGDRWFDHTEKAMLLLSKKKYASKSRYGYVRGSEAVRYVRDIRARYRAYADIAEKRLSADNQAGVEIVAPVDG